MSRIFWTMLTFFSVLMIAWQPMFSRAEETLTQNDEVEEGEAQQGIETELRQAMNEQVEVYVAENRAWLQVEIGIIGTASDDILQRSMAMVREKGYYGLLIELDTPGGALAATRTMVRQLLTAPFPVAVWVGPAGARAGSAGAFITLAGHIAAMAPGTNIGAAQPVQATGQDIEDSDIKRKIESDTVAFIESIAKLRGRNTEMAASFVVNSVSITAEDALDHNVIDFVVRTPQELLQAMDGRQIELAGRDFTLETSDAQVFIYEKSLRERFLEILSNPNIFYLLFIAGLIGIGIELTNPGAMVPGVLGAISMIMALIATSVLPVNFGAMLLILVSLAFMVAEVFIPSFGILGIGGVIAFVVGSVLLIDSSGELGLEVSWLTILPGALAVVGFGIAVSFLVYRTEHSGARSGVEAMTGRLASAIEDFTEGSGRVRFEGEYWRARLADGVAGAEVKQGDVLEITEVQGLELIVRPSLSTLS